MLARPGLAARPGDANPRSAPGVNPAPGPTPWAGPSTPTGSSPARASPGRPTTWPTWPGPGSPPSTAGRRAALEELAKAWSDRTRALGQARQTWHHRRSLNGLVTVPEPPAR